LHLYEIKLSIQILLRCHTTGYALRLYSYIRNPLQCFVFIGSDMLPYDTISSHVIRGAFALRNRSLRGWKLFHIWKAQQTGVAITV